MHTILLSEDDERERETLTEPVERICMNPVASRYIQTVKQAGVDAAD